MAGDGQGQMSSRARQVHRSNSTPTQQKDGAETKIPLVQLSRYQVNVRSFHPNKFFEPGGFRFEGDDRPFSVGPSYFSESPPPQGAVTSRIWQRYELNLAEEQSGGLERASKLRQESNASGPGSGLSEWLGTEEAYDDPVLKPKGTLIGISPVSLGSAYRESHGGQQVVARQSWYGGENHAFVGSRWLKRSVGATFVPDLDVTSEIYIRLERVNRYMDIVSLVYGDAFPNCEGFICDPSGRALILGTHVRLGIPSTHLAGGNRKRFMWANALRVRVDTMGNFGDEIGIFAEALGGPSSVREKYPIFPMDEFHSARSTPRAIGINLSLASSYSMWWNFDRPESIAKMGGAAIHLSAFADLSAIRSQLGQVWQHGRFRRSTLTEWNRQHINQNPNRGRSPDEYDLSPSRWGG